MSKDDLIQKTDKAITELVYPKYTLQKAYNYYNCVMDPDQYRYIEEEYGIGNPTSIVFIPLIKKHIDALVGEYLNSAILPKVTCKDEQTISKMDREKQLFINTKVFDYLHKKLNNQLIKFLKNGQSITDDNIQQSIDDLIENLKESFTSEYEIAAQNVVEFIMQSRDADIKNKLATLFKDILIGAEDYYRCIPSAANNNVHIEVLDPLNTFVEENPESPYVKDSPRAVVRKWLNKQQILSQYGDLLSTEDKANLDNKWMDTAYNEAVYFVRSMSGIHDMDSEKQIQMPGYPAWSKHQRRLVPVYEVEWIETDSNYIMQRYKTVRIGSNIYILYGKDEHVVRSVSNPRKCTLDINGVYYRNRSNKPFSLVLTCASLQDKYNILCFFRDNLISSSGTTGDFVDVSVLPKFLGSSLPERLKKWIAYKKGGIAPIDSSMEGRLGAGQQPLNTIYNGYDDTVKVQAVQAVQLAIDSVEQTTSSITGVFRERLNGIQQRDAVTNVQTSVNNSFTITRPYYQQMDTITEELLLDALNVAKIVYKNGLSGRLILGDKQSLIFTALPEYFTLSDYDIHIVSSTDVTQQLMQLKQIVPELVKAGAISPDLVIEALTTKSLTQFKLQIKKSMEKQNKINEQIQQLQQQNQQLQEQYKQAMQQLQQAQQKIESLNEAKIQIEAQKIKQDAEINWFKARTDKSYKDTQNSIQSKRTEIELAQLRDGNPYNDQIGQE